MATAPEMRAQIAYANILTEEAVVALRRARYKIADAIAAHQVTDSRKLSPPISLLRIGNNRSEDAIVLLSQAIDSANQYARVL